MELAPDLGPVCAGEDASFTPAILRAAYVSVYSTSHDSILMFPCSCVIFQLILWLYGLFLFVLSELPSKVKLFLERVASALGVPGVLPVMLLEGFCHAERRMNGFAVNQLACKRASLRYASS